MQEMSKLQIRAKVLSVISEIKSAKTYSEEFALHLASELENIPDKETIFDIFIKEFIKMSDDEYMFASCIIKSVVSSSYIQDKVFEMFKSSSYSDETKYKLVQLLRVIGSDSAYDAIPKYFENPQEVLDLETQKLLENAVFNPESMLDFLDFTYAVPKSDKKLLLASLQQDYKGDVLANIVYPVLYSDFDDDFKSDVVEVLSDSKSSLAIEPFNFLIKVSNNPDLVNACKLGLKKLKIAGASEEKADAYFQNVIKSFRPAEFYTTLPDGSGNQALLISRVDSDSKYCFEAVVINDEYGIVDCFGFFNISKTEISKIIAKFYNSEGKYKVSPEYIKYRINEAFNISVENKNNIPYEFICWNILMRDINPLSRKVSEIVDLSVISEEVEKDEILELLTKDYTLRWFIKADENEFVKRLIDKIYNKEDLTIEFVNEEFKLSIDSVFDDKTVKSWIDRLYNLIYLLSVNSESNDAVKFYSLLNNEELFSLFKSVILQRSVFNNFVILKENLKESLLTVNIFRKNNKRQAEYDAKKLDFIIDLLGKNWINE